MLLLVNYYCDMFRPYLWSSSESLVFRHVQLMSYNLIKEDTFLYMMFALTRLSMAKVQAETCSTHLQAQFNSKQTCVVFD